MNNPFERERTPEEIDGFLRDKAEIEAQVAAALAEVDGYCKTYDEIIRDTLPWQ